MGFDDEDFAEVLKAYPSRATNRNATLYKLAGNSMVVSVIEAIFKVLLNGEFDEDDSGTTTNIEGQLELVY